MTKEEAREQISKAITDLNQMMTNYIEVYRDNPFKEQMIDSTIEFLKTQGYEVEGGKIRKLKIEKK